MKDNNTFLLNNLQKIKTESDKASDGQRCMIAPSPKLRKKILKERKRLADSSESHLIRNFRVANRNPIGMNDGLIYPGDMFPLGTPPHVVRSAAARRAPLSGVVRVIVVLVEFSDKSMTENQQHFEDLFFSEGVMDNGSVKEYYAEATNNSIDIQGEVVGPYTLPLTLAEYANGASGTGTATPNARTMAKDAVIKANPDVDFSLYDNDGDGFVDAFIVIHAGSGAEETGDTDDIWSHKWVLAGGEYNADSTKIYAYLTVPEDARIGVCCHELGHLLFGFPDLYDTDGSSEGVGNWCLMGGGSWNGGGDIPAHPGAWCKADQGWVNVINQMNNATVNIADVKDDQTVYRLWKDGASGSEYFLVENRQKDRYDAELPGEGLLIWHIDDTMASNSNETHYKVALEQADGNADLESANNRGDAGDTFPGSAGNTTFNKSSTPHSKSYGDVDTCVAVTNIAISGPIMQATLSVKCGKSIIKDYKDRKDNKEKEVKEYRKEYIKEKEVKEYRKDYIKEKDIKEIYEKSDLTDKRIEKPITDKSAGYDKNPINEGKVINEKLVDNKLTDGGFDWAGAAHIEPFIDASLRPDLSRGALSEEPDVNETQKDMQKNAAEAKRNFDTKPRDN